MEGRHVGELLATAGGEVQVVNMKMDNVEFVPVLKYLFNLMNMMGDGIPAVGIKAQSLRAEWNQVGVGQGIGTGEQCDVVALTHEFLGHPGHNPFRASVEAGRNTLVKRRHLCNPHSHLGATIERGETLNRAFES